MKKYQEGSKKSVSQFLHKNRENRKKLYKAIWLNYGERDVLTRQSKSRIVESLLNIHRDDPCLVSEFQVIVSAFIYLGLSYNHKDVVIVHKKYWVRFHKGYYARKTKNRPIPHLQKTKAIKEFLARGFIHKDDSIDWGGRKYTIEATIAPLVWPESFNLHQDAIEKASKIGIGGYTKCPTFK